MKIALLPIFISIAVLSGISSSCIASELHEYIATIEVTPSKSNGKPWDFSGGAPDILLKLKNFSNKNTICQNKYKCEISFISRESEWYIEVYDKDFSNDDLIGKGDCKVDQICKLDNASITIRNINLN